jgi:hypothetical protein
MSSSPKDTDPAEPSEISSLNSRLNALNRALDGAEEPDAEDTMTQWDGPPPDELGPPGEVAPAEEFAPAVDDQSPPPIPELPAPPAEPMEGTPAPPRLCPICSAERLGGQDYCNDCGFMFPPDALQGPASAANQASGVKMRVKTRYEFGEPIAERLGVSRHKGIDYGLDETLRCRLSSCGDLWKSGSRMRLSPKSSAKP